MSKTAVSFAFNSPERLSAETAIRIREVADTLGYRPNPVARMLTQRQTMTLGPAFRWEGMVDVAQLVEHRTVAPGVAGSNPVIHPIPFLLS